MALVKASEIGEYVYCHRAWWLHHVVGQTPAHSERRKAGTARHKRHGRLVRLSQLLLLLGLALLAAAGWLMLVR